MKHLSAKIKECDVSTPANTMGMGNPGIYVDGANIEMTEPIQPLFKKKRKKHAIISTKTKI